MNGVSSAKPAARLTIGDTFEISLPAPRPKIQHVPEALPLSVLYEDDELLILSEKDILAVLENGASGSKK